MLTMLSTAVQGQRIRVDAVVETRQRGRGNHHIPFSESDIAVIEVACDDTDWNGYRISAEKLFNRIAYDSRLVPDFGPQFRG